MVSIFIIVGIDYSREGHKLFFLLSWTHFLLYLLYMYCTYFFSFPQLLTPPLSLPQYFSLQLLPQMCLIWVSSFNLRAAANAAVKVDLREEKLSKIEAGLKTQNMINQETSEQQLRQWKGAVACGAGVPPPELRYFMVVVGRECWERHAWVKGLEIRVMKKNEENQRRLL